MCRCSIVSSMPNPFQPCDPGPSRGNFFDRRSKARVPVDPGSLKGPRKKYHMEHSFNFEGRPDHDLAFSDDSEALDEEEDEEDVPFEAPDSPGNSVAFSSREVLFSSKKEEVLPTLTFFYIIT